MFMCEILFTLLISLTNAADNAKYQVPRPHKPLVPVVYPDDYCMQWDDQMEFDYVVVGAGPGGAPLARRLAEDPNIKVLILEAGGNPTPASDVPTYQITDPAAFWNITTLPKENQCQGYLNGVCQYTYIKSVGGCSVNNVMMYTRGNHKDFDEWEATGCPGWGYKDMKKYFLKLENFEDPMHRLDVDPGYHNEGGPFTTSPTQLDPLTYEFQDNYDQALRNMDVPENNDSNGAKQTGFGQITGSMETTGYRGNVAKAYLLNIPDNLKVCQGAIVQKLQIDSSSGESKVVTGVEFVYNGTKNMVAKAKKEYILSAGPISSPQILERSGVGRKDVLEKAGVDVVQELEGVGENLWEQFTNIGCAFSMDLHNEVSPSPLSLYSIMHTMFLNLSDFSAPVPDMQWIYTPLPPFVLPTLRPDIASQYSEIQKTKYVLLASNIVLRQTNTGFVHIAGTDPNNSPLFQPNQYTSETEKKQLGEGCRLIRKAMKDKIMAQYNPQPIVLNPCKDKEFNSDDEIFCQAGLVGFPLYHLAGTTKMGPKSDKTAVVNPKLQVYGFDNLRICDLGVMPFVPRANTEIPTIAVSEMAADVINGKVGGNQTFLQRIWTFIRNFFS